MKLRYLNKISQTLLTPKVSLCCTSIMKPGDAQTRKRSFCATISQSHQSQPHSKRSKLISSLIKPIIKPPLRKPIIISPLLKPISKPTTMFNNLDDLPDFVLVEILCRLPREFAVQCMCVSKRWFSLVSNPYFVGRFLRLQSDNHKPLPCSTLIFTDPKNTRKFFSMSDQPLASRNRKFSLSFLPLSGWPGWADHSPLENKPIVVAAYNDLVLCCDHSYERDYYVCNPYTKQWDALPPAPPHREVAGMGFICEPYYYKECNKEDANRIEEESTTFQLNVEYRYRVVRLIAQEIPGNSFQFIAEIFSSETRKWTDSLVVCPRRFCFRRLALCAGVAGNGMLYWSSFDGFIIGLDPYSSSISTCDDIHFYQKYNCRFIDKPPEDKAFYKPLKNEAYYLGVCRGCLRMCVVTVNYDLNVWELEDDQVNNTGKWCLVGSAPLLRMALQYPVMRKWRCESSSDNRIRFLAFDPNDKDKLYLQMSQHIVMCNVRAKTFEWGWTESDDYISSIYPGTFVFPFVLPWWPTPVLNRRKGKCRFIASGGEEEENSKW